MSDKRDEAHVEVENGEKKMIFLSHTYVDKSLVEPIANRLAKIYGKNNVFYDSWSIQPGDGIIEKMSQGLDASRFFFFFISTKSLSSKMVALEWQNALYKAAKGDIKFIPVKLDKCLIPAVLTQSLYIDLYSNGLEIALRQMIDVIDGENTYKGIDQEFENIHGYVTKVTNSTFVIEFRAEYCLEPVSRYCILVDNDINNISIGCKSDFIGSGGTKEDFKLSNGESHNAFFESVSRGTTPGFPYVVRIETKNGEEIKLAGLMRAINDSCYKMIPIHFTDTTF